MTATSLLLLTTVAACGSSAPSGTAATTPTTSPTTATDPATTDAVTTTTVAAPTTFHGRRYCEVLLVKSVNGAPTADVYNSFPLNTCPTDKWAALDAAALATSEGVTAVVKNGPRFWLMDRIEKAAATDAPHKTFGGIEMALEATAAVGTDATTP